MEWRSQRLFYEFVICIKIIFIYDYVYVSYVSISSFLNLFFLEVQFIFQINVNTEMVEFLLTEIDHRVSGTWLLKLNCDS